MPSAKCGFSSLSTLTTPSAQRIAAVYGGGVADSLPRPGGCGPESLHVTLKFIGEKPAEAVEEIKHMLCRWCRVNRLRSAFAAMDSSLLPKAARVFWVGIESWTATGRAWQHPWMRQRPGLGIPQEEHRFSPHLTLARGGGRSGAPGWRKRRSSESELSEAAGKIGGAADARVWYHDGPRVFSLSEPAHAGRRALHED